MRSDMLRIMQEQSKMIQEQSRMIKDHTTLLQNITLTLTNLQESVHVLDIHLNNDTRTIIGTTSDNAQEIRRMTAHLETLTDELTKE